MSEKGLKAYKKNNLLPNLKDTSINPCGHCLVVKQHLTSFASIITRKSKVLELVYTDVCGPLEVKSFSSSHYFIMFIDNTSRKLWAYAMKNKNDVM